MAVNDVIISGINRRDTMFAKYCWRKMIICFFAHVNENFRIKSCSGYYEEHSHFIDFRTFRENDELLNLLISRPKQPRYH